MHKPLDFKEQIGDFFSREGTMSVSRFVLGGVLGAAVTNVDFISLLGISGAMVGLASLAHFSIEKSRQRMLMDLYREEIAASPEVQKSPEQVEMKDLFAASKTPDEGGRGSYAIKNSLSYFADVRKFYIVAQAATAALMTGALIGIKSIPGLEGFSSSFLLAGGAALLYNEMFNTVVALGSMITNKNITGTITKEVRAITEQLSLGGQVSPTRVFGVFVEADPKLAKEITDRYGEHYDKLDVAEKREIAAKYAERYHLVQLTHDINQGHVRPTELGFLAYGQHSGVPRLEKVANIGGDADSVEVAPQSVSLQAPRRSTLDRFLPKSAPRLYSDREKGPSLFEDKVSELQNPLSSLSL